MAVCMNIHINVCVCSWKEKKPSRGAEAAGYVEEDSFCLLDMKCCMKEATFILYHKMFPIIILSDTKATKAKKKKEEKKKSRS